MASEEVRRVGKGSHRHCSMEVSVLYLQLQRVNQLELSLMAFSLHIRRLITVEMLIILLSVSIAAVSGRSPQTLNTLTFCRIPFRHTGHAAALLGRVRSCCSTGEC